MGYDQLGLGRDLSATSKRRAALRFERRRGATDRYAWAKRYFGRSREIEPVRVRHQRMPYRDTSSCCTADWDS
jgi:hypothetical protein